MNCEQTIKRVVGKISYSEKMSFKERVSQLRCKNTFFLCSCASEESEIEFCTITIAEKDYCAGHVSRSRQIRECFPLRSVAPSRWASFFKCNKCTIEITVTSRREFFFFSIAAYKSITLCFELPKNQYLCFVLRPASLPSFRQ